MCEIILEQLSKFLIIIVRLREKECFSNSVVFQNINLLYMNNLKKIYGERYI